MPAADFYDYNAKYHNADSKTVLHPDFPEETVARIQDCAVRIFRAIDGAGLARVDFFVEDGTNEVVFNEINTFLDLRQSACIPCCGRRRECPYQSWWMN